MTLSTLHLELLFLNLPSPVMVLEPSELKIVAANNAYLEATMREHHDIVGKLLFDAFPGDPTDPHEDGTSNLKRSIKTVLATKQEDVMPVVRYPIPRPKEQGGGFVERYWRVTNSPVLDEQGKVIYIIHAVTDVTAQTRAEHAAEHSSTLVRMAGQFAKLGWWRFTLQPEQLYWSEETARIHDEEPGFSPAVPDAINFYKPAYRGRVEESFQNCIEAGQPFDLVTELTTAKGRDLWVRSIGEPERNASGEIVAVRGAFQDISDLVHARNKIAAIDNQLRQTLESISDAFFMLDHDWRFVFVNSQAEQLLQMPAEDLQGATIWKKFPEAVGSTFETEYRRAVRERITARFTEYYPPRDFWIEVNAYPTKEGLAVYFRDVTEQINAAHELQVSKERFDLATKATKDVIWDWDIRANSIWWSEAYTEQFGHERSEEGDPPESWLNNIHPDDHQRITDDFFAVLNNPAITSWQGEYRFLRADGREAFIVDRCHIVRTADGKPQRLIGSVRDITERIRLDERLHQSQKMEAVGQLTGGIAHDFNNLLTVLLGNSELIAQQLPSGHHLKSLAEMTVSAAERGSELTSRLLSFARRQPLSPKPTAVNDLIEDMFPLLKRTLAENIEIKLDTDNNLWLAELDPGQLESAILNLAINARDAMSNGGMLTIETGNTHLDSDYCDRHSDVKSGDYVRITVSDTGSGMTHSVIQQAFEPFFTTKTRGKGSGLGLSMVYGYVKQSNGHIKIYSEIGSGTSVKLYLPRCFTADEPETIEQPPNIVLTGDERILVVEDDELVRQHVVNQLHDFGYDVVSASAGKEALEILQRESFDLLFSDVVMPGGMNGPQLAAEATARYPELKVLFTSGYTENAIIHQGRLDPGVKLLSKPYRRQELAAKIREVLDD